MVCVPDMPTHTCRQCIRRKKYVYLWAPYAYMRSKADTDTPGEEEVESVMSRNTLNTLLPDPPPPPSLPPPSPPPPPPPPHPQEMSYNNYLDADAAWNCASEFGPPTCVVVKHTNPCGVASSAEGGGLLEAYRQAVRADPVSAFGGIVAFNTEVTEELAREIREFRSPTDGESRMFYEIVVAPSYSPEGLEVLKGKSKTLRVLEAKKSSKGRRSLRQVGGVLTCPCRSHSMLCRSHSVSDGVG